MDTCKRDNDRDKLKYEKLYNYLDLQTDTEMVVCVCVSLDRECDLFRMYQHTHNFIGMYVPVSLQICIYTNTQMHRIDRLMDRRKERY
jgi:hypothetical protein